MSSLYDIFSYPFGWILWLLYHIFNNNYALALIAFTILAKLLLLPSSISTQKNQAKTRRTQAKIQKIRKKYAGDQAKLNAELQTFYEKEGYGSMTAGCGTLLIQFPIIMGLYGAIYKPLSYILRIDSDIVSKITDVMSKISANGTSKSRILEISSLSHVDELRKALPDVPSEIFDSIQNFDFTAFGLDLGSIPQDVYKTQPIVLAVPIAAFLAAMVQSIYSWLKSKQTTPDAANNASMGCMFLFMPFMSLWLAFQFPIGIGIYWAANSILGFIQVLVLSNIYKPEKVIAKMMVDETINRRSKEESIKINTGLLNNMEENHD